MFYVFLERNTRNAHSLLAGSLNINARTPIFNEKCFMYILENIPQNANSDLDSSVKKTIVSSMFKKNVLYVLCNKTSTHYVIGSFKKMGFFNIHNMHNFHP